MDTNKNKPSGRELLGYVMVREVDGVTEYWSEREPGWSEYISDAELYDTKPAYCVKAVYAEVEP